MPAIVDFPTVVKEALALFGDLFDTEPARRHFAEYLTGLMVAENKTVSGINREFALTTDQSCLNRWLTGGPMGRHGVERSTAGMAATGTSDALQRARRHCHR
jgi:hypothetical protein